MNIGQQNMQDRALFYLKTYDKDYKEMNERDFRNWTVTLKPFFDEFNVFIRRMDVKEHFMHIFNTIAVSRHEIEDTTLSSGSDARIIESNMSYARRVAKHIIEEGRIWEDLDIAAPFTTAEFNKRVADTCDSMRIRFVQPRHVFDEFTGAGLIEPWASGSNKFWRFKYKIATLTEMYGLAIGVTLESRFTFIEEDYGTNESPLIGAPPWKGSLSSRLRI
jgi:hypothetical protein